MSLLAQVVDRLTSEQISHCLIGATAMAVHGVSRSTIDIDLLSMDPRCLHDPLWNPLRITTIQVEVRRGDVDDPLAGVVRFDQAGERSVDIVVAKTGWTQGILLRAERQDLADTSLPVARAPDLVLLKLYAGSAQDAWDIEQLLSIGDRSTLVEEITPRILDLPDEARLLWSRILRR